MKTRYWTAGLLLGLIISACVTINVYFPEAEVQQAAGQFIDQIIGTDPAPGKTETVPDAPGQPLGFSLSVAWISSAQAAADLNVATPAIRAIQSSRARKGTCVDPADRRWSDPLATESLRLWSCKGPD